MTSFNLPQYASDVQIPIQRSEVYIEVGARPAELAPVRVVAAAIAARADFDFDAVADLKMAVDEACATLARLSPLDARLRCLLQVESDRITVTVRRSAALRSFLPQDTFSWRVLTTLTDEVKKLEEGGRCVGIRLVMMRRAERT